MKLDILRLNAMLISLLGEKDGSLSLQARAAAAGKEEKPAAAGVTERNGLCRICANSALVLDVQRVGRTSGGGV
ncbi:hypothetical protein ACLB2K_020660 [Fragaria x ananassa]